MDELIEQNGVFVHPTSIVEDGAKIGEGTKIWHFCHVMPGAQIGKNCMLGQNVFVGGAAVLGNGVRVQNNVSVFDAVVLEDFVFVGPSATFTNVKNPRSEIDRKSEYLTTLVKRGATIGANATILPGITIGEYAFVGAGAVVTKDVPDYGLVVGAPAKLLGFVCKCGFRLDFNDGLAVCKECGLRYLKSGEAVKPITQKEDK